MNIPSKNTSRIGEKVLIQIIREKINYKANINSSRGCDYDGFDMSGYGQAHFNNLELISRFSCYMVRRGVAADDWRVSSFKIPIFWKGGWTMRTVGNSNNHSINDDDDFRGGETTEDILLETILANNSSIIKDIESLYPNSKSIRDILNRRIVDEI